MVTIPLGINDWESRVQDITRVKVRNMYVAENPRSPDGMTRVSRPSLSSFADIGAGPIKGMWRQDGSIAGDWLIVSGLELYRVSIEGIATLLGSVPGTGFAQFTGIAGRAVILRDGIAYSTDGASITPIEMPDGQLVGSITSINSYILLSVLDSDRFYWIKPGDINPGALDFATAERSPDPIRSMNVISDEIWILGSAGPEVWISTGDATAPFQRIAARVYNEGCETRDAAVEVIFNDLPALVWVTSQRAVVLAQNSPSRISNESIEELLRSSSNFRAWTFRYNRHSFYILTTDDFTLAYDLMMNRWYRWDTYNEKIWVSHLGGQAGAGVFAGDAFSGKIWRVEEGLDDDGLLIVREISGMIPVTTKYVPCSTVIVNMDVGNSPSYYEQPLLEMRWSDDEGYTWSEYKQQGLGYKGQYGAVVQFRSLGTIPRPGRVFEFRFTGHSRFRLDYATMNDV